MYIGPLKRPAVLMLIALLAACESSTSTQEMLPVDESTVNDTIENMIIIEDDFITRAFHMDENSEPLAVDNIELVAPDNDQELIEQSIMNLVN